MKYLNNISILKDPVRKFKVSHIVQNEEVTRYYLHYQPQEENTNTVSNDNENLAIAGPSRNVRVKLYFFINCSIFYYIRTYIYYYMIININTIIC